MLWKCLTIFRSTLKPVEPSIPKICVQDEPPKVPINLAARFDNKVGSLNVVDDESLIKE